LSHLEEEQVRQFGDVVRVVNPVIPEDVTEVPQLRDDVLSGGHGSQPLPFVGPAKREEQVNEILGISELVEQLAALVHPVRHLVTGESQQVQRVRQPGEAGFRRVADDGHAHQRWTRAASIIPIDNGFEWGESVGEHYYSHCQKCHRPSFWVDRRLIYPASSTAPMPVADMPDDVKADYMEARDVFEKSARSAGGLLRIGFEKLFKHLGVTKTKPNDAIGELVQKGLALGTQQRAMDVMRVFANQSSHDGFVKLEDQPETVTFLFTLLNYIVEQMITRPKQIDTMFTKIPPDKLVGIEKRDAKK
jgi:hypothetical protein